MAREILFIDSPNQDMCVQIMRMSDRYIWDASANGGTGGFVDNSSASFADTLLECDNDIDSIPSLYSADVSLDDGRYMVIIYEGEKVNITDSSTPKKGYDFEWRGKEIGLIDITDSDGRVDVSKIDGNSVVNYFRQELLEYTFLDIGRSKGDTELTLTDDVTGVEPGYTAVISMNHGHKHVASVIEVSNNNIVIAPGLSGAANAYKAVRIYSRFTIGVVDAITLDGDSPNNLSASEVNSEVDSALADYDPPTKDEMDTGFNSLNNVTANEVRDAILQATGVTEGGTHDVQKAIKLIYAFMVGKWQDKSGDEGTYEILDPEDDSTVIMEVTPRATSPRKVVNIL